MKNLFILAIKKIPRYCQDFCKISYNKILSIFFKNKEKFRGAWLICERGIEAKDNGYMFFKYMRENHPEKKVFYLLNSSNDCDYQKNKTPWKYYRI